MKRFLSAVLVLVMLFGVIAGVGVSANAVNATPISFGQTINSSMSSHTSKDYSFNVSAKGEININLIKYVSTSMNVSIYDSNYELLGKFNTYEYNKLTEKYTLNFNYALMPGNYYLRLENGYANMAYQLTLKFTPSAAKPTTFALPSANVRAMQIELGETICSTMPNHSFQNFVFNTKIGGTMSLDVKKYESTSMRVFLYDSKFNEITDFYQYDYNEVTQTYTLHSQYHLNAGVYYLRIENGYSEMAYGITLSFKASLAVPGNFKCVARSTNAQKVSWNKVAGVTGYQVQCSDGGSKWAQNKSGTGTSATFKGLTAGGKYKFRVRAYKTIDGVNYFSAWSPTLNSCAKPATVTLKSVTSPKHTQIKTTWAKAGGVVTGYQIVYSRNKAFTNLAAVKNVAGKNTVTYTGKNFTQGRTYFIKVRAYTVFSGKTYYGAFSAVKSVKSK